LVSFGLVNPKAYHRSRLFAYLKGIDFSPELYTIWNFGEATNVVRHFGNIPPQILDNLLYYYTQPLDVVFDPFAGGGMTIDVCQQRQRRYYVSDLTPSPARLPEQRLLITRFYPLLVSTPPNFQKKRF